MALFRHKVSGELVERPAHYADHPVLGRNLELVEGDVTPAPETSSKKKTSTKKTTAYVPFAEDGDGDGLVQDGTEWERPVGVEIPQEQIDAPEEETENNEE